MRDVTLHLGDCLDVMRSMPDGCVDAVVCDPPYTAAGGSTNGRSGGSHEADTQFFLYWLRDVCSEISRVVKPSGCGFMFCDWRTAHVIGAAFMPGRSHQRGTCWRMSQALVWDRECFGLGAPFRNGFEMIAFVRGPDWKSDLPRDISTVIRHRWPYGNHSEHGAEKPVDLCAKLVRWASKPGDVVLDPFTGSGSVALAALAEGRSFVGIEREPEYHAIAEARIAHARGETLPSDEQRGLDFGGAA